MDQLSTNRVASRLVEIDRFFSEDVRTFQWQLAELDAQIDSAREPEWGDAVHRRVLAAFEESQAACARFEARHGGDPQVLKDVQDGFRRETAQWFERSWIAHRARSKPSGFAGDYEMLIKLYEEATPARGLGGYLDLCILDLPLARAVRARMKAAREFLVREIGSRNGNVRVLDIASGPCREYLQWPSNLGDARVEVIALDNDPLALAYVNDHVACRLPKRITLNATRYNAVRMRSAETTNRKFGKFDIIYSVGLFDYLPDDLLIDILGALPKSLAEGGVVYIGFKDTERYDKTPYQWHLDWFFFQRTKGDCLRLYERAGIGTETVETFRDDTGIIMNFLSRQAAPRILRTDGPESVLHGPAVPLSLPTSGETLIGD
jgi:SAM-dependent methyltransferase